MSHDPPKPENPPLTPTDREHLQILSIFYYFLAALIAFFSFYLVIYVAVVLVEAAGETVGDEPMAVFIGGLFVVFALLFIGGGLTIAGCLAAVGQSLARHQHYTYCFAIAAITCAALPIGTALGIFTIIVLLRDSVREAFGVANGESNTRTGEPPA